MGLLGKCEKDMPALNMEEKPSLQEGNFKKLDNSQNQERFSQLKGSIQRVLDCST